MSDQDDKNSTKEPYPSDLAIGVAVKIELMVACGGYKTVAYGRAIQEAMDAYLKNQTT